MSQESKLSSEQQPTNKPGVYICCVCGIRILDHAYRVQRRTVRAVRYNKATGKPIRHDAIHTWHDGIKLGPEYDIYCPKHNAERPTGQELLDAYHESLNT